jgi:hypothetical protein
MEAPYLVRSLEEITRSLKSHAGWMSPSRVKAVNCAQQSGLQARVDVGVLENAKKRADDDKDDQHEEDRVERRKQPDSAHSPFSLPAPNWRIAHKYCTGFDLFRNRISLSPIASFRAVRCFVIDIADEVWQIGVTQLLADRRVLTSVIPVVIDHP